MKKRFLLFCMVFALLITMLASCKTTDEDFEVGGDTGFTGNDKDNETEEKKPSSDSENKKPSEDSQSPSQKEENEEDPKEDSSDPSDDPKEDATPAQSDPDQPSSPEDSDSKDPNLTFANLTQLQKVGEPFEVAAGETVWFGPMPITAKEVLTFNGKSVQKEEAKEAFKLGGGYHIFSYKAPSAGSIVIKPSEGYESRFLISKEQEMSDTKYHLHWDMAGGANLYDPNLDSSGKTISWNGKESNSTDYHLSHAIRMTKGETLTFGPCNPAQVVLAYGYNANQKPTTLINANNLKQHATFAKGMSIFTYTATEEVAWVRLLVPKAVKEDFCAMKNQTFDGAMIQLNPQTYQDPLKDATGLFAGDSINHGMSSRDEMANTFKGGTGGWAARVERDTGLIATNVGKSGYHFTDVKSNYGPINDLLQTNASKDFDYVVLQGGYNDACKKVPLGVISDSYDLADFDTTTFAGGMERTIYNTIKYHGDTAAIGFIVTFKIPKDNGIEKEYYDLAKEICEKWGIDFLDLYNHEKLNADLKYDTKEHTNDFVHPDASGYELITPYVIDFMRTLTPCNQEVLKAVLG